jgi:hypothetical protein
MASSSRVVAHREKVFRQLLQVSKIIGRDVLALVFREAVEEAVEKDASGFGVIGNQGAEPAGARSSVSRAALVDEVPAEAGIYGPRATPGFCIGLRPVL